MELGLKVIAAGGIRLPPVVADLVQGDWQVVLPDESVYVTVKCRELFIWSFRNPFVVLGAESAEMVAFEFNLKPRQARVKVGGLDLLGALQDSELVSSEDGAEDL